MTATARSFRTSFASPSCPYAFSSSRSRASRRGRLGTSFGSDGTLLPPPVVLVVRSGIFSSAAAHSGFLSNITCLTCASQHHASRMNTMQIAIHVNTLLIVKQCCASSWQRTQVATKQKEIAARSLSKGGIPKLCIAQNLHTFASLHDKASQLAHANKQMHEGFVQGAYLTPLWGCCQRPQHLWWC